MISKKILSVITSVMVFCCVVGVSLTNVKADDSAPKSVDGSYLTSADSSTGYTPKNNERGKHLMDGQCSISKTGTKRIYAYGSTTANHTVDTVAVIVYVDQYNEKDDEWYQIDAFSKKVENDYYSATSKSIQVERGYYYRVHADHFVRMGTASGGNIFLHQRHPSPISIFLPHQRQKMQPVGWPNSRCAVVRSDTHKLDSNR